MDELEPEVIQTAVLFKHLASRVVSDPKNRDGRRPHLVGEDDEVYRELSNWYWGRAIDEGLLRLERTIGGKRKKMALPKVSHVHQCLAMGAHWWEHKTYSCEMDQIKLCPEHEGTKSDLAH